MKKLLLTIIFLSGQALATTCTFSNLAIPVQILSITKRDSALPLMISSTWHEIHGGLTTCSDYKDQRFFTLSNNIVATTSQSMTFEGESYQIYSSGVDGIGLIMSAADINSPYKPFTSTELILSDAPTTTPPLTTNSKYRVRFVATKKLPAKTINLPSIDVMRHGIFMNGYFGWGTISTQSATINVTYPSCKLNIPTTVKLPIVASQSFDSSVATAGDTPFSIELNCGSGSAVGDVKYTLTDISSPTNTTSTLDLAKNPNSASGIGIQILEGSIPVRFGPDSPEPGTTNQRNFGTLTGTNDRFSKSFVVRYIRTASPLVAGKVNAGMSITLSYQ
ncbi:fimbrial protein [Pseudomonas sp. DWP1b1]|uniref:fimbrial protein n=1 Tax=unclassified Pseudomonas TaxID=196821 RepID=UPI003CE8F1EE